MAAVSHSLHRKLFREEGGRAQLRDKRDVLIDGMLARMQETPILLAFLTVHFDESSANRPRVYRFFSRMLVRAS
jgi:hypothetical protein